MGKFSEALKAKLAQLGKAKVGTYQDFIKDPQKELDQIYLENDEFFIKEALSKKMQEILQKLPPETQQAINSSGEPEEKKWEAVAQAYETQAGEQEAELAAGEIERIVSPSDPRYPPEKLYYNPHQKDTDALRNEIKPEDPEAQEKRDLLQRVDRKLSLTSNEALAHFNRLDSLLQNRMDAIDAHGAAAFIDSFQGGKYASRIPRQTTSMGIDKYMVDELNSNKSQFSVKDSVGLVGTSPELSPQLKKDVLDITDKMAANSDRYYVEKSTVLSRDSPTGKKYYYAEQGTKAYAFWPLQTAYSDLAKAVQEKDYAKIREAEKHYDEMRKLTDGMMATMGKYKTPLCGGNVNSTRTEQGRTAVPTEHLKDFVTHSKLNGIYLLHGFSKNTGIPVKKLLEDPVSAMREGARKCLENEGLHNIPNTGAKLFSVLSREYPIQVEGAYLNAFAPTASRGMDAVASMEKDPKKRERILGVTGLAIAAGGAVMNEYRRKLERISKLDAEKLDYLYQHAALLPEEEFDPVKVGDRLQKENWKKEVSPQHLAKKLREEGKLDYNALAEKTEKVIHDAEAESERENAVTVSNFSQPAYSKSSMKIYNYLIRTATPEEKKSAAFLNFRNKIYQHQLKYNKDTAKNCQDLDAYIARQQEKKSGWFMSSTSSPEHDRMVLAQRKLQYKLKQLRGEPITDLPPDELEALKKVDLKRLLDSARTETYTYCRLKTDNGIKDSFVHEAGADRYNDAFKSLAIMDAIADSCGLRSPGERLLRQTKYDLLENRSDKDWTREHVEDAAARVILGMTLAHGKKSFDDQAAYLQEEKLQAKLNQIKQDPAFRRMMQNEGMKKMADNIIIGDSSVTNAYITAKDQLKMERDQAENDAIHNNIHELGEADQVKTMTAEDKIKMWESNPIQL